LRDNFNTFEASEACWNTFNLDFSVAFAINMHFKSVRSADFYGGCIFQNVIKGKNKKLNTSSNFSNIKIGSN